MFNSAKIKEEFAEALAKLKKDTISSVTAVDTDAKVALANLAGKHADLADEFDALTEDFHRFKANVLGGLVSDLAELKATAGEIVARVMALESAGSAVATKAVSAGEVYADAAGLTKAPSAVKAAAKKAPKAAAVEADTAKAGTTVEADIAKVAEDVAKAAEVVAPVV